MMCGAVCSLLVINKLLLSCVTGIHWCRMINHHHFICNVTEQLFLKWHFNLQSHLSILRKTEDGRLIEAGFWSTVCSKWSTAILNHSSFYCLLHHLLNKLSSFLKHGKSERSCIAVCFQDSWQQSFITLSVLFWSRHIILKIILITALLFLIILENTWQKGQTNKICDL